MDYPEQSETIPDDLSLFLERHHPPNQLLKGHKVSSTVKVLNDVFRHKEDTGR